MYACTTSIFRTWLILASRQWHKPPQVTIAARTCRDEDEVDNALQNVQMFYTTLDWHWRLCYLSAQHASGVSTELELRTHLNYINDLSKQIKPELIIEIVKWETRPRSDSNRFLCRHCPAHSLGPSDSTKTGRAESSGMSRSQSCTGGKFFWARGLRT